MEDVGWGDILHSPVDLHGYVDGAMLHYYCITLERHVIIALDTIPIHNIYTLHTLIIRYLCLARLVTSFRC